VHLTYRNVNEAFWGLVDRFDRRRGIVSMPSRVGDVLMIPEPVTITYEKPLERVLFNQARDANPFFHLYETLWMLAGRSDIAPLEYYSSKYPEFVQDGDNPDANGAYGARWRDWRVPVGDGSNNRDSAHDSLHGINSQVDRGWVRVDQLEVIADRLKKSPNCRRQVLEMWSVHSDLLRNDRSKDVCCNTHAYFLINAGRLDMTVCNRSNDLILGALGANVVHFSFLQEYMAARIGVEVGVYHQFTNNLHTYTERFRPEKWLADQTESLYDDVVDNVHVPLVRDPKQFNRDLCRFVGRHSKDAVAGSYQEPFLQFVAQPMCVAFHYHKRRKYDEALAVLSTVKADDWQFAGKNWILKRKAGYEKSCALKG
jgi:thymidylate synthase